MQQQIVIHDLDINCILIEPINNTNNVEVTIMMSFTEIRHMLDKVSKSFKSSSLDVSSATIEHWYTKVIEDKKKINVSTIVDNKKKICYMALSSLCDQGVEHDVPGNVDITLSVVIESNHDTNQLLEINIKDIKVNEIKLIS